MANFSLEDALFSQTTPVKQTTDCLKPKNCILSRPDNTFLYIRFCRRSDKARQEEVSRCCVDIVVETLAADFGQSPALESYFPD